MTKKRKPSPRKTKAKKRLKAVKSIPKYKASKNLSYYQKIRSEVSSFYKEFDPENKTNPKLITSKTKKIFSLLKKESKKKEISPAVFKQFISNIDVLIMASRSAIDKKDDLEYYSEGINWWALAQYIDKEKEFLSEYSEFIIDCKNIFGEEWAYEDIDLIETSLILKEIRNFIHVSKKKEDSTFLFWEILKSKDGKQIVFELIDREPDRVLEVEGDSNSPEQDIDGTSDEVKTEEEPKQSKIKNLIERREALERSYEFYEKSIKNAAQTIKQLKEIGLDEEVEQEKDLVKEALKAKKSILQQIEDLNKKINS